MTSLRLRSVCAYKFGLVAWQSCLRSDSWWVKGPHSTEHISCSLIFFTPVSTVGNTVILRSFVDWVTGGSSSLGKFCHNSLQRFAFRDWPYLKNGAVKEKSCVDFVFPCGLSLQGYDMHTLLVTAFYSFTLALMLHTVLWAALALLASLWESCDLHIIWYLDLYLMYCASFMFQFEFTLSITWLGFELYVVSTHNGVYEYVELKNDAALNAKTFETCTQWDTQLNSTQV